VAIVVRAPKATAAERAGWLERTVALTTPPEAATFAHGDPAMARGYGAAGVQLRMSDLPAADARRIMPNGWIGLSVHSRQEAERAIAEGADYLLAGNVFATASHPDRPAKGLEWLADLVRLGRPVVAIGGVTPERAARVRDTGAWGVAAVSALWIPADPARAAAGFLEAWSEP
jgi:thiamine-phosphate diphosphorylase